MLDFLDILQVLIHRMCHYEQDDGFEIHGRFDLV